MFPHTCVPNSPLPYALTNNDRFSLSDLFSLGSRPDRPAHCRHLTISPHCGSADRAPPAIRVSPLPCFRPGIDGHRLPRSPLMGTVIVIGQSAPGRDPSASSASIYNQQTVSKHRSQRFTTKSRPNMLIGVADTTQPMWAASQTVRDPAGPYTRRAHSVSPDRLDGRHDSDGVIVTYQKTRDLSASVFLSSPLSAGAQCQS